MTALHTRHIERLDFSHEAANNFVKIDEVLDTTNLTISDLLTGNDHIDQSMSDFLDGIDRQRSALENVNEQLTYVGLNTIAA